MKLKKVLSICLVGALAATLLAGCSDSSSSSESETEDEEEIIEEIVEELEEAEPEVDEDVEDASEVETEDTDEGTEETNVELGVEKFEDTVTIKAVGITFYDDTGTDEVIDAINEISKEAINVVLDYTVMDMASFMQQASLMLAGGESIDLLMLTSMENVDFTTMTSQNQLLDLTDYLDEYAPDILDMMGDLFAATTVDGRVYAIPAYKPFDFSEYILMRKDVLDYLGLTEQAEAISSWSEFEDILLAVKEAQDELPEELQTSSIICNAYGGDGAVINIFSSAIGANDFSEHYGIDCLGDSNRKLVAVDDNGQVYNYYDTDDYRETIEMIRRWYEEGLIYTDAQTNINNGETMMQDGGTFCFCAEGTWGMEINEALTVGYELVAIPYCASPVQTSDVTQWGWCVPVTAKEPEAAVAFLDLMYNDPEIVNLFTYGFEGRDYEFNDEGEIIISEDAVYQNGASWLYGNMYATYMVAGGGGADFWDYAQESSDNAENSPYLGFSIDTDPVANELTAISSVLDKYRSGLESGATDPSLLDDMLADLDSAGAQIVLDYYQEQLDEWLAEQ